jgi:hypothetical protein
MTVKVKNHSEIYTTRYGFVSCKCGAWSLSLKEQHRLRTFKKVLKRIPGPKREEGTGGWRKLHTEELCNLKSLTD